MSYPGPPHKSYDPIAELKFNTRPAKSSPLSSINDESSVESSRSRASSNSSAGLSLKSPRTARFAEATAVHSPIEPVRSPFADPPRAGGMAENKAEADPADVGFGYIDPDTSGRRAAPPSLSLKDGPKSPLKSALKVPGTPGRLNPLSPTFREEEILEKQESRTEKENAKDLKVKVRVRIAKMVLRGTNFSCSLIVLSMLASTFSIFNATKNLPARNNLPAWASGTSTWPQITLLTIACVSLAFSLLVMWNHWKGKQKRAAKTAAYYTVFSVAFFIFSVVMWAIGAGLLNSARQNGNAQDLWGWSCKDNKRKQLFENDVSYALVCRLQNWSLVCAIIEIVVELITILIYSIVFYRYYSKRRLRKSMDTRDKARSDLYLAQLRTQSAPNTPGFGGPMSPRFMTETKDALSAAEEGEITPGTQFASRRDSLASGARSPKPFQLQPPPIKIHQATPSLAQGAFSPPASPAPVHMQQGLPQPPATPKVAPSAPGERTYAAVGIPGAYASPVASPSFAPARMSFPRPGQAQ